MDGAPIKVMVDLDGVIYDWSNAARRVLEDEFSLETIPPSSSYNSIQEAVEPHQWEWLWTADGIERSFSEGSAYPNAVDGARLLHRLAYTSIVTSGPTGAGEVKEAWLERAGVPYDEFHLVPFGGGHRKSDLVRDYDLAIEDSTENILDLVGNTTATVLRMVRPWNSGDHAPPEDPRIIPVLSWADVIEETMKVRNP